MHNYSIINNSKYKLMNLVKINKTKICCIINIKKEYKMIILLSTYD